MKKHLYAFIFLFLAGTCLSFAQQRSDDELYFRRIASTLGSDEFGGRQPMTEYETKTLDFLVDEFKKLGLEPANGDSYFQDVPLLKSKCTVVGGIIPFKTRKGTLKFESAKDILVWTGKPVEKIELKKVPVVFAGFGIVAPEYGWNDYAGLDVKGKIVVVLINDPGFYVPTLFRGHNMTYYGRWTYKFEEASRQGAAGVLIIHDTAPASYGWNVIQASNSGKRLESLSNTRNAEQVDFKGWITLDKAKELFANCGTSYESMLQAALEPGFRAREMGVTANAKLSIEYEEKITKNVAGILPGTDLKDEYVVYSAHWDHFGYGNPVKGDSIYNGASDNASGVAGIMLIAKKFGEMKARPRRSIMFFVPTAEESGLYGSEYYVRHPLVPLDKTSININFDAIAPRPHSTTLRVRGMGDSDADEYVYIAAAAQGRVVNTDCDMSNGMYFRSDHFNFVRVGVPTVIAYGGFDGPHPASITEYQGSYHTPQDEYSDSWDCTGTMDDLYLNLAIGLGIANAEKFPKWNPASTYQRANQQ